MQVGPTLILFFSDFRFVLTLIKVKNMNLNSKIKLIRYFYCFFS